MSSEFGNDFISIIDDDGNVFELEHHDTIEIDDTYYMAFLPADIEEDDEDYGLVVILKVVEEDGEEILVSIDDDDLLEELFERFIERLPADDEDE